ncbi:MAG: LysR family transcriptional regulator, partial [Pseudomonadales bacterium RIFCSPLOWO2_02_FULL_63_210]
MAKGKDISMRQLRYFVAAADAGQFSQAALKVHVSQSAITAAVLQLEQALGVSLFERLPYGVALTAEGNKFAQHARHILDTLQDALSEPLFLGLSMQGVVRVGASYTVLGYFLPALLARFKRSYPQVEIDLLDMDRPSIETAVLSGELDLGLAIISNTQDLMRFEHHVLIRSRRQLWLATQHPLNAVSSITLADVAEHAYIMPTVDEGEVSALRYWQSQGRMPKVAFRTSSMEALRGLVA